MSSQIEFDPVSIKKLIQELRSAERWLVERSLDYARRLGYTPYTSTLYEPWRIAIAGLTDSVAEALTENPRPPDLRVEGAGNNRLTDFGVLEARLHRARGITLGMFLGFFKCYRQTFLDLIEHLHPAAHERIDTVLYLVRAFDAIEVAIASEWADKPIEDLISEMQEAGRDMTNEKNKYLTVFESLSSAVVLFKEDLSVDNANLAALTLLTGDSAPGKGFYTGTDLGPDISWLSEAVQDFWRQGLPEATTEQSLQNRKTLRTLEIRFKRMLDISGKFTGVVAMLDDITHRKSNQMALEYAANHDALTGVLNRNALQHEIALTIKNADTRDNRLGAERADGERSAHLSAYLMVDLDLFKPINDSHGHAAGDHMLKHVAELLSTRLRNRDVLARLGGDEFAVILNRAAPHTVKSIAERIRKAVETHDFVYENSVLKTTVSIGAALIDGRAGAQQVMEAADQALYLAKARGRNTVVLDDNFRL